MAVASATLIAASADPASAQSSASLLSATGCTDGTFVDLAANPRVTGANNDLVEDCQALVAIHNHWAVEPLNRSAFFTSWGDGFSEKISTWYGVTITNKRVTSLGTTYTWTSGTIPPEIGNLAALTSLSLSNHYFTGSIPAELGSLTNLTSLDLSRYRYNRDAIYGEGLSGAIPTQLGNLNALTTLNLIRNQLTGNIPTQLGSLTNLTTLNLAGNRLTGGIPAELGSLTKLNSLALDSNRLTSIPTQLGNLNALTTLNLSNNRLTSIPTQLGNLNALTTLNLANNQLAGSIPTQLGNLNALTTLNLSFNALSGSIPTQLGSLTNLAGDSSTGLNLSHNVLSGNIPTELGNLTKVVSINLSKNLLTGSIPAQLNQLTKMSHLELNNNRLSGNIPTQLGRLASSQSGSLAALYICNNYISGNVPTNLRSSISDTSQYDPIGCQAASNIAYSAPTGLVVNTGRSITIDASRYVEDGEYNISCRDATGKHSTISSITRNGCVYTINAGSTAAAAATFTVPYTSTGSDTHNGEISVAITSASGTSDISFTAPSPNPAVAAGQSIRLNAAAYASDGSYTITCGDATNKHTRIASISRAANSCLFTITAGNTTGSATFTVPYTSSGGDTHNGIVTISIGAASNIAFTPPSNLSVAHGRSIVINASSHASDSSYTISCGEAIRVSTIYQHWLPISQNGCSYTVRASYQGNEGVTAIAIPYTSSGGDTHLGVIFINIGPRSNISFTAPRGLSVAASRSIDIDAAVLASDSGGYTLSCSDATNKHAKISTITRNGCTYTVTAGTQTGTATFTVPYTSTGGDTHNGTITITIGPASNITFTAPTSNPTVAASRSIDIDAAVLASDSGGYTLSCSDATNKHAKISTITRNGCTYTVTAGTQTGTATFTVPYTSTGGDTHNGTITITIGPASNITFTPPANLTMEAERNLTIDASQYATDGTYAISCYNPRISGRYRFASWRSDGCTYTLVAGTATGSATLIVNYRSSGGDTHRAAITITINPTTTPLGAITALSATGCTDGTFVNLTDYPRVQGTNNDLVEDCQALVAIQNHWAAVSANNSLPANHPLRTWGVGASQKIQNWTGAQTIQYDPSTSTLTYLDRVWLIGLYDQDISGTIPAQFGNLTGLTTVLLRDNKLTGAIPTRLGNLSYLDLSNNRLTGSIPTQLSSLTRLSTLNLANNRLTGTIPTQLSSLTNLWQLDISNNRLTGTIPTQLSSLTRLSTLNLANNRLTGTIPTQLSSLTNLWQLDISNNRLTGTIPTQLSSLTALNRLGVCNNHLGGAVPSGLQSGVLLLGYPISSGYSTVQCQYSESSAGTAIPALSATGCTDGTFVDLTANPRVSGTNNDLAEDCQALVAIQNHWAAVSANNNLPASHPLRTWGTGTATEKKTSNWANITITNKRVTTLNLFNPAGSNPGISGSVPAQLGNLTSLTSLNLTNNQLSGSIPTQLGSLTALTNLGLGHNQLTGSIPTQLGSLTSLRSLSLYNNQLSGTIPTQLGSLTALTSLSFGSNGLSGSIPSALGSLTNLTSLNLSANQLTGSIPTQLSSLTNLTWLNLSLNRLSGSIPTQLGDLTKLIRLDLGGNSLSGKIPNELSKLTKLMWLDLSNNRLAGSIPIQLVNLVPATGTLVKIGRGNLRNLLICGNYLSGSLPQASLLTRTLVGYPSSQPSNSIGCQRPSQIRLTVQFTSVNLFYIPGVSTGLSVPAGRRILIDTGSFVRDGDYSISCADATGATANISSISRNGCRYTVAAGNTPGSAGFTVLFTSSGGGTLSVRATLSIGSISNTSEIVFSPPSLQLAAGSSLTVNASTYASDGSSTISCADAKGVSSKISITSRSGCSYVVAAQSSAKGVASFTVPYTSTGGDTHDGIFTINISNIAFTAPTGLAVTAGSSAGISIDASTYVSDGDFAVSCADATSVDSKISVVRHSSPPLDISGLGCTYAITAGSTAGTATFTVPYTSTGGDTHNGIISVTVNAAPTLGPIPALSATGCTDGTFVDLTDNPRVEGSNNDLAEDCLALVAIQNHWAGVAANNNLPADHPLRTWGTGTNKKVTSWQGVTIRTNRVTSLNLNNQAIAGSIPTQLGNLTNLTALWLSSNQLTGSIPTQLGNLTKLVSLNLRNNRLTGSIPTQLGSLTKLQGSTFSPGLNLSNNQFTGSIPTQLGSLTELVSLSLSTNQLTGSIPAELGSLTKLTNLNLSNNQLTESIPTQLGNLTKLTALTLINNRLTGSIPTQLGDLINLTWLDLSNNRLTGSIPAELGSLTKLTDLNLSNNQLTGSIPTALSSLTKLTRLLLNDNKLSGTIPTALASLAPDTGSLTWMEICRNYFTGAVPTALRTAISSWQVTTYDPVGCQYPGTPSGTAIVALSASGCTDGTFVDLTANPRVEGSNNDLAEDCQALVAIQNHWAATADNNNLAATHFLRTWGTGTDKKIGTWAKIRILNRRVTSLELSHTFGTGPRLAGTIPAQLGNLTALTTLGLSSNRLTGSIPAQLGNLTNLTNLNLSGNQLTGTMPTELGNLTKLTNLNLSVNRLSGSIPTQLGNLTNLTNLNLTNNRLTGTMPTELGNLTKLTNLNLSVNRLSGSIPTQFGSLTKLTILNLYDNKLTGNIPTQLSSLTELEGLSFTAGLNLGNNQLSGSIPAELGNLTKLVSLNLSSNRLTGSIPAELGNLTKLEGSSFNPGLNLYNNQLTGSIPKELGNLTKLTNLSLANNQLTGSIPKELGNLTKLQGIPFYSRSGLDLSNNQLTGNIPKELGQLTKLVSLSLNNNNLSGNIPAELANLAPPTGSLTLLTICQNYFTGAVPTALRIAIPSLQTTTYDPIGCQRASRIEVAGNRIVPDPSTGRLALLGLSVPAGRRIVFDALDYISDGGYAISCGNPTSIGSKISVTRNGCLYTIKAGSSEGSATFTAIFSSAGGTSTPSTLILVLVGSPSDTSEIEFSQPPVLTSLGGAILSIDASTYASDGSHTIMCADATRIHSRLLSVTREGCVFTITPTSNTGIATFTIPYTSSGGDTHNGLITVAISNIIFVQTASHSVAAGRSVLVNASGYATDGDYSISCEDATSFTARITSVVRTGCSFTVTTNGTEAGSASFTVPFVSAAGGRVNGRISITLGPASNIQFTAPTGLSVAAGGTIILPNLNTSATDGTYTVSCGEAASVDSKLAYVSRYGCSYIIVAGDTAGTATFTIPFTSSGGDTHNGAMTVAITAASDIVYTAPTGLTMNASSSLTVDASSYATDGSYAITCRDAAKVDSKIASIARTGCSYRVTAGGTPGTATFTVPYSSSGGDSHNGVVSIAITAASSIVFTAPVGLSVPAERRLVIDAASYATDSSYTITCGDAKSISDATKITAITRNGCSFAVTAGSITGSASFTVPYSSSSGATKDGTITITIAAASATSEIVFAAPAGLSVAAGRSLTVDASPYATDGSNTITCGTASNIHSRITRISSTGCSFTITAGTMTGTATFTVPYDTSGSGASVNGVIAINITVASNIRFAAPAGLSVVAGGTFALQNAAAYATDGSYSITCGTATGIHTRISSVNRPDAVNNPCRYTITAGASEGFAIFSIPYTSSGGDTYNGIIPITITKAPAQPTESGTDAASSIPALSTTGCTDGTFVDLAANPRVEGSNNDLAEDCQALVAIQNHWVQVAANNNLATTHFLRTWGTGTDKKIGTWEQVVISNKRVSSLVFWRTSSPGIAGTIPTQLANLTDLTSLYLSSNQLAGTIPTQLGNLTKLTNLSLGFNRLSGNIPTELGNLANLTNLGLSNNQLTGRIPTQLGNLANLTNLDLGGNRLTGRIPTQLGNLTKLSGLSLAINRLTGRIPTQLGNLTNLRLDGNQLTGSIPTQLGSLTDLTRLSLSDNRLTGNIPTQLGQLTNLRTLELQSNQLTGSIPVELDNLAPSQGGSLTWLNICNNYLAGTFPTALQSAIDDRTLFAVYTNPLGSGCQSTQPAAAYSATITPLSASDCTNGTFVNLSTYPRVEGPNNDLAEDCLALVAIHTHWAGVSSNYNLPSNHDLRLWGTPPNNARQMLTHRNTNWEGVTISDGRVTGLRFYSFDGSINGAIPAELGNLTALTSLYLSGHELVGNIPAQLGNLTNLTTLNLSGNDLTGRIPTQLGQLTNLTTLNLSNSQLTGNIPTHLGNVTNLTSLNLANNQLTGNIPAQLGNLTNLTSLNLANNQLTGSIPTELGNLTNLTGLSLAINRLTGSIPTQLGQLTKLEGSSFSPGLNLSNNQLTGSIPTQLGQLTKLVSINLANNQLTGSIPAELGNLTKLEGASYNTGLNLSNNQLTGSIPTQLGQLTKLTTLDLSNNQLTGNIPVELGNLTKLEGASFSPGLNLSNNQLTGTIPTQLGQLTKLTNLNISNNQLTGTIPTQLGSLSKLQTLILRDNRLTGTIPAELGTLAAAEGSSFNSLDICNNYLTGAVPTALRTAIRDTVSYRSVASDPVGCQIASDIKFSAPADLSVTVSGSITVDASSYATDGIRTITCADATGVSALITINSRNGCSYQITAGSTAGTASFTVPYTSSGGDTHNGTISIAVKAVSNIVFNAPTGLSVPAGRRMVIDAASYASDGSYAITCADAAPVSASITIQRQGCSYVVTASSTTGAASFTVPYTSSGGDTESGTISLTIAAASSTSNIVFVAPAGLTVATGGRITVDASQYATDGTATISCADATGVSSLITLQRTNCSYAVTAGSTAGTASFTVPYTSSGGDTHNGTISIAVTAASDIAFTAPSGLSVAAGSSISVNASRYAKDGSYQITCADAASVSSMIASISRNGCSYSVMAGPAMGTASFTVPYTSSGGDTHNGAISIAITDVSDIVYTSPSRLEVNVGRTLTVLAGNYAADGSYSITCSDATRIHSRILRIVRNGCSFLVTVSAIQGQASFTLIYTSSGGDTHESTIFITVNPSSNITFTAPTGLSVAAQRSIVIDASEHAEDGPHRLSCGTATNVNAKITVSAPEGCSYTVTAGSTQGTASFTVPYTSSGGDTETGTISVTIGPPSNIVYTAPTGLIVGRNRSLTIDAGSYVTENSAYTVSCADATGVDSTKLASVTRGSWNRCSYTIDPIDSLAQSLQGSTNFTIPYTSTGGDTHEGVVSVTVGPDSLITYTAPSPNPRVSIGRNIVIDASAYASDGSYTISCQGYSNVDSKISRIDRTGCSYTITASSQEGTASFTLNYFSSGGHTLTRAVDISIVATPSNVVFTAPTGLKVGRNRTLTIDALNHITEDSAYTVSCADATGIDGTKLTSVTRSSSGDGCTFTVDPIDSLAQANQGDTTFSVLFTSTGGDTTTGTFTVNVGPDSTITYTAPTGLKAGRNRAQTIDASDYASDGSYTITCGDATHIHSRLASVTRTPNTCSYTITPISTLTLSQQGAATFTITYTSEGGHTRTVTITVNIGPDSAITYNAPTGLKAGRNRTLTIDASAYAAESHGGYTITCGDATNIDTTKLVSVTRTANTCSYTITPISTLTLSQQGDTTFTITFTSEGGHRITRTITVNIGPPSNIVYTAPPTTGTGSLNVGRNRTLTLDASSYVTENSAYTITCGDATNIDTTKLVSITRNGCSYTITPISTLSLSQQGNTTFTITYTSTGGHTRTVTITINIGPPSTIVYAAPTGLNISRSGTRTIDASAYVSDGSYTITCADATSVSSLIASVTRNGCSYRVKAGSTMGSATFNITYTSTGGHTRTVTITINIGPTSNITYTAPAGLKVGFNSTLAIDASAYVSDGPYTITCGDATSIDTTKLTSVVRDSSGDGCSFTVTSKNVQGTATFTVPYTSSGGDTATGTISVEITPISYTAPVGLKVVAGGSLNINASGYATHTGHTISCGDAKNVDSKFTSVTRADPTNKPCEYTVTAGASARAGAATFTVPYTSTGGATLDATVTVTVSSITFTPPASLKVGTNRTQTIDASWYVLDGSFTISCGDATSIDTTKLASVTRTANTCSYTITPISTLTQSQQGSATFTVPYTSSGGDTYNGIVTIEVGPPSTITYTAPTGLKVGRNRTLTIDASEHVADGSYTFTCGDASGVDATKMVVIRTGGSCTFTVDPVDSLAPGHQGDTTFSVAFTSTGGATALGTFTVNIGPDSTITYTAPTGLTVGRNRTLTINASDYVTENPTYTITCGDATSVYAVRLLSVTRTPNSCSYTVTPIGTLTRSQQGAAFFTVPYTSSGGATTNAVITINIGPDSTITYTAPAANPEIPAGGTIILDVSSYASDGSYTISCGTITESSPLISISSQTGCDISVATGSSTGSANISIPYASSGGHTLTSTLTIDVSAVSDITFTAPTGLKVGINRTQTINALDYVSDGTYTITCGDATSIDTTEISSVVRDSSGNGCSFTITPKNVQGAATFTVPYTSAGGDTYNGIITIEVGPPSTITYTAPIGLKVASSRTLTIDASDYATESHNGYTITCGDATSIDSTKITSVARTANTCSYTVTAGTTAGAATFTVPYTSTGGATLDATVTVTVSSITFTPPASLKVGTNRTQTIDATWYVVDGSFTISCGDATSIDTTEISSVVRDSSGNGCSFTITPKNVQGAATFTVPYTSAGGDTYNGIVTIEVGPPSTITYTAPTSLKVGRNRTLTINASDYVTENPTYTIYCGDATGVDATKMTVTRGTGANACTFTVDPVDSLAPANQGDTTFSIPFTSEGGHSITRTITVNIGPDSTITYTAPTGLTVGRNRTLTINASDYVTENPTYTITCGDATSIDSTKITSVVRTANTCSYTVTAGTTAGAATFIVPYTSTGGATQNATVTITVSSITFTAPTGLKVGTNRTQIINASWYVTDGSFTFSCGDATSIDTTKLASVTRTANTCSYTITPISTLTQSQQGAATFTVPYTSAGGDTYNGIVTIEVGPPSTITYTAPTGLKVGRNRTLTINASNYVTDGTYTISCGAATSIDTTKLTSVVRDSSGDGCSYTITPIGTLTQPQQGDTAFSIPFTSEGGHSITRTITVNIGPDSTITYTAPTGLTVGRNRTLTINASDYVTENPTYTIYCGDATSIDTTKITSVVRDSSGDGCSYTITPIGTLTQSQQGDTAFSIPYTSSGGATANGTISVNIGPASIITYRPPTGLSVGRNRTLTIDASAYANDGSYTITCGDATNINTIKLASVTRTANTCSYTITPISTLTQSQQGTAAFAVPYISSGGATATRLITINIGPDSTITYTPPAANPAIPASSTRTIDVSSYASDGSYTISCGTITESSALISLGSQTGCSIGIVTGATLSQTADITIPYTSSGGHSITSTLTLHVGAVSNIVFTAPTGLKVGINRTQTIDASDYVSDGGYTITCGTATSIDTTKITSVVRDSSGDGCSYTITPIGTLTQSQQGAATFTVPYTSSGGNTLNGVISIEVGPSSTITYTAASLNVATSGQTLIDASSYAADGSYAISCGDAKSIGSKLNSITRTANTCSYWVTAGSVSGSASFVVPYTSSGGHTLDATVSITIVRPLSVIVFREPFYLDLATNRTLTIDASDYASDAYGFTISCADATGVDSKITIQRTGCSFVVTPTGATGTAVFTVPYTSSGGDTYNAVFAVDIGSASAIAFSAPSGLTLGTNRSMTLDASSYAADGSYLITCDDATGVDSKITVTRPNANARSCEYSITPTGATGTAAFTVPYTSSGGHTANGTISIQITAASTIVYSAPTGLTMTAGSSMTINAASYATDGSYTITCADATARDAKIIRITNTGCSYEITSGETTGTAAFTIPYTSAGGHALNGQISIAITARPQNEAPVFDRQSMMCAMLGYQPVRHSTADRITEADSSATFCRTPTGIICLKADRRAEVASLLINILGMDASLNNCYNSIR